MTTRSTQRCSGSSKQDSLHTVSSEPPPLERPSPRDDILLSLVDRRRGFRLSWHPAELRAAELESPGVLFPLCKKILGLPTALPLCTPHPHSLDPRVTLCGQARERSVRLSPARSKMRQLKTALATNSWQRYQRGLPEVPVCTPRARCDI